ncbi:unnamed protein product [Lactuca saligna]|uniref:Replication factor A C-terminal domain-containing protein n=1 Tax=Lactuca saligna TaxID=75948 RepID=A0AA35Z3U1_LACSI|nr:unnamed protein product [Lactuca saligna]
MTSISKLKCDGIGSPIELRIVCKWKHDVRRYETWFIRVDRFGDAIQILGQRTNQSYIESVLNVSECYTISKYSCPKLHKYQKVLENDFYIDVGLSSIIKPLPNTITIPATWFRFASKSQLTEPGEHPPYDPDFVGMLSKIRDSTKHVGQPYVLLILTDDRGNEVLINLWKECFTNPRKFNRSLITPPPAMTVVAVTNLKPSLFGGTLRHGSSHATHVYDKMFLVKESIADIVFQDKWYQMICPTCRDPIFKRGTQWYYSAHSKIEKPILTHKFHVTISDPTATMSAVISETSFRKLINSDSEHTVDDIIALHRKTLLVMISQHKGKQRTMSIQMLKTSTDDNVRFIIIDIEIPVTSQQSAISATPSQPLITRSAVEHCPPLSDTTKGHTARTLTFTANDESAPSGDVKRTLKK